MSRRLPGRNQPPVTISGGEHVHSKTTKSNMVPPSSRTPAGTAGQCHTLPGPGRTHLRNVSAPAHVRSPGTGPPGATWLRCTVRCVLTHFPTGQAWAEGLGAANSRERSLRWRSVPEQDLRPEDRRRAVRTEERIDPDGRRRRVCYLANDPWDLDNCVVKSACRRALIAAAQTVFGGGFDRSDRPGPGKSEGEGWAHDR